MGQILVEFRPNQKPKVTLVGRRKMMDKEAQLEIRRILDNMLLVQKTGIEVPLNHYAWDILDTLGKLGYVKLPPDSAILEGISNLANIGDSQSE